MAVVKGIPAAALAYHNPSGVLVDDGSIAPSEESHRDSGPEGTGDGGTAEGQTGVNGETTGVVGNGGGGGGGGRIGTGSSRFRCHVGWL